MSESTDSPNPDDNGDKMYPLSDFWVSHDGYDIVRSNLIRSVDALEFFSY